MVLGLVVAGSLWAHAQPKASYLLYDKAAELGQTLNAFAADSMLYASFSAKVDSLRARRAMQERYAQLIHQVTPDLKHGQNHQLLERLVETKDAMHACLTSPSTPDKTQKLLRSVRATNQALHALFAHSKLALSPSQDLLYTLRHMQMVLEEILVDYVVRFRRGDNKSIPKETLARIDAFVSDWGRCETYTAWHPDTRPIRERLMRGWGVMRQTLHQKDLPLVVEVAARHLSSLVQTLREIQTNQREETP